MAGTPPFDPALREEFSNSNDPVKRIQALEQDLVKQPVVTDYIDGRDNSKYPKLLKTWAPTWLFGRREFFIATGSGSNVQGYAAHRLPYFVREARVVITMALIGFGIITAVDIVLRALRQSMVKYSEEEMSAVISILGSWNTDRRSSFSWLVPDIVFRVEPFPIVSFLSYSPAILLGVAMFAVFLPLRKLPLVGSITAIFTVAVCFLNGLGVIYAVKYWTLATGFVCLAAGCLAIWRSREYLAVLRRANEYFDRVYWPVMAPIAPKSAQAMSRRISDARRNQAYDEFRKNKDRFDRRNNSERDASAFWSAERDANYLGRSTIPDVSGGFAPMGGRKLGEIIRDGKHSTNPQELAQAAGITVSDAEIVLRGGLGANLRGHLSPDVARLYEMFN
ncbi:hypothetical protein BJF87_21405 [Gordonia sp. CNJ-863]|uniref:hypothetical protein n=1 Tax=Gordonia sp. CNJ-863 TaxID=1904963 RepID=UPI00095EDB0D|nr:hypothetical protein [Gordonia sp. CNJ-863]OLT47775.1 hypothetical protein BJF87_21405 [Gordonia sp. CNJ-863]